MSVETVEAAEAAIRGLEDKHAALVERGKQLEQIRASNAYAALANGDSKARQRLDALNRETAEHGSELASAQAALRTAHQRLAEAQERDTKATAREKAQKLREAVQEFLEIAGDLDEAIGDVATLGHRLNNAWREMQLLGAKVPTHSQMESLGGRAVAAAITGMPWSRLFSPPPISPHERHSFAELATGWAGQIERACIAPYLGTQQTNEEAA
jgi:chromosome segregation ATPase